MRTNGEIYIDSEVPPVAEVTARGSIKAIVGSLNLDGETGGRYHQIRNSRSDAAGLVVACYGHEQQAVL